MNGHALPSPTDPDQLPAIGSGSMGLRGVWALVGNSTAMVVIAVAMLLTMLAAWSMHESGMALMQKNADRTFEESSRRDEMLGRVIDRNTEALDRLTREITLMRGGK